jgi:hypothetical protein
MWRLGGTKLFFFRRQNMGRGRHRPIFEEVDVTNQRHRTKGTAATSS